MCVGTNVIMIPIVINGNGMLDVYLYWRMWVKVNGVFIGILAVSKPSLPAYYSCVIAPARDALVPRGLDIDENLNHSL